jgi:hypothetical protein
MSIESSPVSNLKLEESFVCDGEYKIRPYENTVPHAFLRHRPGRCSCE